LKRTKAVITLLNIGEEIPDDVLDDFLTTNEQYILDVLQTNITKAEKIFNIKIPLIPFKMDLKGKCAGEFWFNNTDYWFRFNEVCFMLNQSKFDKTIIHELCHYIAHLKYGKGHHHDNTWKYVMHKMKQKPEIYHNLKTVPARNVVYYIYKCSCKEHNVSAVIHKKMQKGQKRSCIRCKGSLYLID